METETCLCIDRNSPDVLEKIQSAHDDPNIVQLDVRNAQDFVALNNDEDSAPLDTAILAAITELIVATFDSRQWKSVEFSFYYSFPSSDKQAYENYSQNESRLMELQYKWFESLKGKLHLDDNHHNISASSSCGCGEEMEEIGGSYVYAFENTPIVDQEMTDLHYFSRDGSIENVLSMLAEDNEEMNAKSFLDLPSKNYGWTPLHLASLNGHLEVVKALLDKGANPSVMNKSGSMPLHDAIAKGHVEVVQYLLEKGAAKDLNTLYNFKTPLHLAGDNIEIVQALIEYGADVNGKQQDPNGFVWGFVGIGGETPLHIATSDGALEMAQFFLEKGADVNAKDNGGKTPLHIATSDGALEMAKLLVEKGADVNAKDNGGKTPLHSADLELDMAELLVEKGADVNAKDDDGSTPLFSYLDTEVIRLLIAHGADVHACAGGETLLTFACKQNYDLETIQLLVTAGTDVEALNDEKQSALHVACQAYSIDLEVVRFLIEEHKADVNAKDNNNKRPLDYAIENWENAPCARYLVEQEAGGSDDRAILERLAKYEAHVSSEDDR